MRDDLAPKPESPTLNVVARRAPVLWVATAVVAGYLGAKVWPEAPVGILVGGALLFSLVALAFAVRAPGPMLRGRKYAGGWGACFLLAGILLAWAWHETRVRTPAAEWASLPPREATLTLRVTRDFAMRADSDYAGGLAEVLDPPEVFHELRGVTINYRVRIFAGDTPPPRGATLMVTGVLGYLPVLAPDPTDPASADAVRFRAYLHAQGAWFELARGLREGGGLPPNAWTGWLTAQHARIEAILRHGPESLERAYGNLYTALLLGEPALLDPAQHTAFIVSGGIYLFAISGLHVGVVAAAVWWVLRKIPGVPHAVGEVLTLAVAWLYVEIAGDTTSGRRVALMLTFYLAGKWLGRARSPLGAVLAAGVATLIVNPLALDNSGFELSYTVVLGLILYAPLLFAALRARAQPWRDVPTASLAPWQKCTVWLWEKGVGMAVTSWTAVLGSAPLTAEFFGVFSAHILFMNLILFPLTCVALWAGAGAVAAGLGGWAPLTWLSWLANAAGLAAVGLMQEIASLAPPLPGLFAEVEIIPLWAGSLAALAVVAAMLLAQPKDRAPRWWYFALPVAILAVVAICTVRPR
jgi:competence protein ComEC